ncbi:hypothetical protein CXB49_17440 [Chromobacterium sp. ATCC 53434]|uniref:hypothetical protein n=1 Tax=Chromobacterium TaxID=535 RepID=UPI000C761890|nr:hypothetical protein [Chromobacterium sp. ATCC 53434]AUH52451.1 hypothetical protein CXB49_17440 [Chromobacterium sp. ATCC 53434]
MSPQEWFEWIARQREALAGEGMSYPDTQVLDREWKQRRGIDSNERGDGSGLSDKLHDLERAADYDRLSEKLPPKGSSGKGGKI